MIDDKVSRDKLSTRTRRVNHKMMGKLLIIACLMFGFGYALIPLYKKICEVTGVNILAVTESNETRVENTQVDKTRVITIEFDANARGFWRFHPKVNSMTVHPGEMVQVVYEVTNLQTYKTSAQAIPSYAPESAAQYFKKMECFCFKQQMLGPNETRQMPVVFYIDPALPKNVNTVTLSYTFFEIPGQHKK